MATTFTVYANQAEEVQKRLARLEKKAAKYSIPFSWAVGEEHPETVRAYKYDEVNHVEYEDRKYTVAAVDISVECDGFIKANGWEVRAKVEHGDNGNIVTGIGDKPVPAAWYEAPACCEHCKTNRFRAVTYFCEHENGTIRQVGRSCLHDYTGISPATAAMWAEVRDLLDNGMDCSVEEWAERKSAMMYSVETVLAHACDAIREFGYRKSSEPNSTKQAVFDRIAAEKKPTDEGLEQARTVQNWLAGLRDAVNDENEKIAAAWKAVKEMEDAESEYDDLNYFERKLNALYRAAGRLERNATGSMERNCIPLALSGYAKANHVGILAYMPLAYERYVERKAKEEKRAADHAASAAASEYVGEIKERITFQTATAKLLTSWDNDYGTTYLYQFTDGHGNVFIWKASKRIQIRDGMTLKGTVKDHNERDGIKQTILTRCTAA